MSENIQHCGICSMLADLFRRIMCIGGSRRGSGESYYQEIEDDRRSAISIDRTDQNTIFIRMVAPMVSSTRSKHLSDSDWLLLETLDTRCERPLHTGRFLTLHKRRRKKLTTRCLNQDPALLDDIHHGLVQCVLDRVWRWPFNAFTLDTVTGGRSLPVLCVHLFHWYGLMDHFSLDVVRVWKLFTLIEEGYHSTNPYHNAVHAADVTQAMHCFLQEDEIRVHLTPLEILASLVAAVTHDLDHPGVNQPFLIATSNHLAALYENTSVLENHHWRSAIGCLLESHVAEQLGVHRLEVEQQISSLILATDITRQQEFLTRLKRYLDHNQLNMDQADHRHFILQIALKCADISNPCRPWDISRKWSQKVCEEFFRQGDYERNLNLPVTSLCDRQTTSIPKIQAGFLRFVVSPLVEEWHRFLNTDLSTCMMNHLRKNQEKWEQLVQQEVAEETHTEISDAEMVDQSSSEEEGTIDELTLPLDSQYTTAPYQDDTDVGQRVGRRHSVPLSLPKPILVSHTVIRRESLPVPGIRVQKPHPSGSIVQVEEEEELSSRSQSIMSSCSSLIQHSSGAGNEDEDRPVSAETLIPEPSIASITTSIEATRLSSVLHGPGTLSSSRHLTRQQTFPPIQPYVRARYMSTTAEMTTCAEVDTDSSSSSCSHGKLDCTMRLETSNTKTLKDNSRTNTCSYDNGAKRDSRCCTKDKGSKPLNKINKSIWEDVLLYQEKENVNPCPNGNNHDIETSNNRFNSAWRNSSQGLALRRGSAPVGLLGHSDDNGGVMSLSLRGGGAGSDRFSRRGSVPTDFTKQNVLRPLSFRDNSAHIPVLCTTRRSSLPHDSPQQSPTDVDSSSAAPGNLEDEGNHANNGNSLNKDPLGNLHARCLDENNCTNQQYRLNIRRSSGPADVSMETRRLSLDKNNLPRNGNNGKSRSRKKALHRRSSGGPEMFELCGENVNWHHRRRELLLNPDNYMTRRRGSLPIDVLCSSVSGDHSWTTSENVS